MNDREGKEVYDLYGAVTADESGKYSSTLFLQKQWIRFADTRVETSTEYFLSSSRVVLLVYMKRYYPKQLRETILNKLCSEQYHVCFDNIRSIFCILVFFPILFN